MSEQYITKVYRQHTTAVTSVPVGVRVKLGLNVSDHIVWQVSENSPFVQLFKVQVTGKNYDGDNRDSDRED